LIAGALLAIRALASEPNPQPLPRLETGMHTASINRIATDAAGRWAVTASRDKTARVWDVASGRQLVVLRPPQGAGDEGTLYAVGLSPDGAQVAVAGSSGADWDETHAIYFFERETGRLARRLTGLPDEITNLTFSPDGRWLAVSLRSHGLRIFDATRGIETGSDGSYAGGSYSADFSSDGRRLLTTCTDGQLRLYRVTNGKLAFPLRSRPGGGASPAKARFSIEDRFIAVGFFDTATVQVLEAETLKEVARPSIAGVDDGNLSSVAWSADGRFLAAAGQWGVKRNPMRRWRVGSWSLEGDVALSNNTVTDLVPMLGAGMLFAAADPAWGLVDGAGRVQYSHVSAIGDLRGPERLGVSTDGRKVTFSYEYPDLGASGGFDLVGLRLSTDMPGSLPARIVAPGMRIEMRKDRTHATLNGQPLPLEPLEGSRSIAISPDDRRFALGTDWFVRLFDHTGHKLWKQLGPGTAWAVNITSDGRFVVVAYNDGTIRWRRLSDGQELLAFFPHADRHRWIAWTPEGFYATSGSDAEELLGYHLNRGKEREGDFVSASQLREQFYQPGLISQRLDPNGDSLIAEAVKRLGDVRELLGERKAPPPSLELLSNAEITTEGEVLVRVRVSDQGGGIGRLIYRIDGVELEGRMGGVVGEGTESRSFPLAQGRHQIGVSVANARGVESLPVRITAEVRPRLVPPRSLHVLAVGISRYRDAKLQQGVRLAAGDAKAIGQLFRAQGAQLFESVDVNVLPDDQATGAAIRAALEKVAARVAPQDVFVFYLAGHGFSFQGTYHFVPWEAVDAPAAELQAHSLSHDDFRALLAKIPAAQSLILLDTCSAGSFGRQDGRDASEKGAIDRLNRLSGRAMIAAAPDDRIALEGAGGHGAFTFALLEGLSGKADSNRNNKVEVRELADYVEDLVPKITAKSGYEQFPFSWTEGVSFALVSKL
jgi:WD40 repeat protein